MLFILDAQDRALLTFYSSDDLVSHMPDLLNGERLEVVFLQEIVCAESKQLKSNTDVAVIVKPVQHTDTRTVKGKKDNIALKQFLTLMQRCNNVLEML